MRTNKDRAIVAAMFVGDRTESDFGRSWQRKKYMEDFHDVRTAT